MTLEVQLNPLLELFFSQQRMHHADHFRTFLVHRQGVKVVHFDHFVRTNSMRHWAGIFGELRTAHNAHIIDTVDRT
ncbi:hypothetical protein D3C87_1891250 [compost metagenome]